VRRQTLAQILETAPHEFLQLRRLACLGRQVNDTVGRGQFLLIAGGIGKVRAKEANSRAGEQLGVHFAAADADHIVKPAGVELPQEVSSNETITASDEQRIQVAPSDRQPRL